MKNLKELKQEIKYVPIDEITPYENNPRENDEAAEKLAEVIEKFGFRSPIYVDKEGVIINGHTRYKAAMLLNYKEVPVVYADDLSENEVKAFRIADNRVSEFSEWDVDMLLEELKDISDDFSAEDLGFDSSIFDNEIEDSVEEELDNAREGGVSYKSQGDYFADFFNLNYFKSYRSSQPWNIPIVKAQDIDLPERFIAFHNMNWEEKRGLDPSVTGVRFFENDVVEDRFWKNMDYWIDRLKAYRCVVIPDYSMYYEMPMPVAMYNFWRRMLSGQVLQDAGIPTILVATIYNDWKYGKYINQYFPKNAYYAISTKGSAREEESMEEIKETIDAIYNDLDPKGILIFGTDISDYDWEKWGDKKHIYDNNQF